MTCCGPLVIGATCNDQINYGETVNLDFSYADENGTPIDLTSASVSVFSSVPDVIKASAVVTITDAANGKVNLVLHRDDALSLRRGTNNRFRIQTIFGPESDDVTPDIYLQVT